MVRQGTPRKGKLFLCRESIKSMSGAYIAVCAFFKMRFSAAGFSPPSAWLLSASFTEQGAFFDKVWVAPSLFSRKFAVRAFLQDTFLHRLSAAAQTAGSPSHVREESSGIAVGIFTDESDPKHRPNGLLCHPYFCKIEKHCCMCFLSEEYTSVSYVPATVGITPYCPGIFCLLTVIVRTEVFPSDTVKKQGTFFRWESNP